MSLFHEQADVSVRPAVPGDEDAVADVQLAAWRTAHTHALGADVLDLLDRDAFVARWQEAIVRAPGTGYRVLVACAGATVVGFTAIAPLPDEGSGPGGELVSLEVDPGAQRTGHGSRLLAAAVDHLRQDGGTYVQTWVLDGDAARAQFLSGAGLGSDEVVRTLATGPGADGTERSVTEHRWTATI
jgi:GNAT superfamily N-acetyltransferase